MAGYLVNSRLDEHDRKIDRLETLVLWLAELMKKLLNDLPEDVQKLKEIEVEHEYKRNPP
jgi:L-rhamnose isomerase